MPNPTPGAQRTSLVDRVAAAFGYQRRISDVPFGPGTPIEPSPIEPNAQPRQFEYTVAANTNIRPRGEYPRLTLTPFEQLRNLARFYGVASICIETRINWLATVKWSIVAKDKRRQDELLPLIKDVERFFRKPDRVTPYPQWLRTVLLDQLEIDALTVYKQRDMDGRLISLKPRDGSTFKPLLNELGETTAYQQILYGYVRGQYDRPNAPDDLPSWPVGGDLLYLPRWTSTDSPYGRSPVEQIILYVNMAIRKQTFDLAHFTDGNVPAGFWSPPTGVSMQPEQVRQFEDAFNADIAGDDRARNRIKMMPYDGKYQEMQPFQYSTTIDDWLLEITCAALHVPKNELGMTEKLNKATSEEQEDVAARHMTGPDTFWLKTVVFDPIIQEDLAHLDPRTSELEWAWDFGETEDIKSIAGMQQADVAAGIITADESRRLRYPDLDGKAPGPPQPPAGVVPPIGKAALAQFLKSQFSPSLLGIWYDPATERYMISVGDWAEPGIDDLLRSLFGDNVEIDSEWVPDRDKGYMQLYPPKTPEMKMAKGGTATRAVLYQMMIDEERAILGKADETVTTATGLVANDLARPKRTRKRGKRRPINVDALINQESAGALEWAKQASKKGE